MKKEIFKTYTVLAAIVIFAALLRFWQLDKLPNGIYSDEVSQGYNAYSLLKTGKDEFGVNWPISIRSFGDWKPPLQTYLMLPTIAAFGLNAWGIRLPSAILGTLTIPLMYFLTIELLQLQTNEKNEFLNKYAKTIALGASFLLAISPWHIQESRSAMLVMVELFFFMLAVWAFLKSRSDSRWLLLSSMSWGLSLYSYYGMRLMAPLFVGFLLFFNRDWIMKKSIRASVITSFILGILVLIPLGLAFVRQPDVVFGRAKTVSIFYDKGVALRVWELIASEGSQINPAVAQFLHNKPYYYTIDIIRRFWQHFDGRFLFLVGDKSPPFQIPNMGVVYIIDGVFILIGIIVLTRRYPKLLQMLLGLIVISVLPASLTFVTPATNRTFTMVVPLLVLSAIGLIYFYHQFKNYQKICTTLCAVVYILCFSYFIYNYMIVLPTQYASEWHYGYDELYSYLQKEESRYPEIVISAKISVPYIFLLYYQKIDPAVAQKELVRSEKIDEFGFEHVERYKNYQFVKDYSWDRVGEKLQNELLVLTPEESVGSRAKKIKELLYPDGKVAFVIYDVGKITYE
jgi:4-amino-4-deoxy-L-arabinose transferase-like glycosyltransferase